MNFRLFFFPLFLFVLFFSHFIYSVDFQNPKIEEGRLEEYSGNAYFLFQLFFILGFVALLVAAVFIWEHFGFRSLVRSLFVVFSLSFGVWVFLFTFG
ncbi:hypothetical protein H6501_01010 [Candidatus Woesearchaeota archaeon]|nr:hypothetical protein [Candidatus Woesearchaeota archaeon]USN44686.1 MAG: hypothetical protein H6500_02485 [Candidatus Woesearchaeota archaeon]